MPKSIDSQDKNDNDKITMYGINGWMMTTSTILNARLTFYLRPNTYFIDGTCLCIDEDGVMDQ